MRKIYENSTEMQLIPFSITILKVKPALSNLRLFFKVACDSLRKLQISEWWFERTKNLFSYFNFFLNFGSLSKNVIKIHSLVTVLVHGINTMGLFKVGQVFPVHKGRTKQEIINYRGVTVMPNHAKVLNQIKMIKTPRISTC